MTSTSGPCPSWIVSGLSRVIKRCTWARSTSKSRNMAGESPSLVTSSSKPPTYVVSGSREQKSIFRASSRASISTARGKAKGSLSGGMEKSTKGTGPKEKRMVLGSG